MEEFLGNVQMLLAALGHKVLEPLINNPNPSVASSESISHAHPVSDRTKISRLLGSADANLPAFRLQVSGLSAYAMRTDEGIVVLSESEAALTSKQSLSGTLYATRLALVESGVLVGAGPNLKFLKNHLFRSPSQAAAVIVGYSINGRENWRLPDGTTWGKYEQNLTLTDNDRAVEVPS